jgi:hypothetical protein
MTANEHNNKADFLFSSVDFQKFLKDNTHALLQKTNSDVFKSKESSADQLFKSKESFSNLFQSMDNKNDLPSPSSMQQEDPFRSKDWVNMKNLGSHVDVSYSPKELFCESDCGEFQQPPQTQKPEEEEPKTNWGDFFFAQLHPPSEPVTEDGTPASTVASTTAAVTTPVSTTAAATATAARIPAAAAAKPKRQRRSSKKTLENSRQYVNPTDEDILLGRGGKSNHHPGNKRYREEIKNFQSSYMLLESKDDKTDLSRYVVDYVHKYKGRFLAFDKNVRPNRWYEVPDIVTRRKVSQALREDDDPIKRKEKRARYLDRKLMKKPQEASLL